MSKRIAALIGWLMIAVIVAMLIYWGSMGVIR
jgi:hypothetical protein